MKIKKLAFVVIALALIMALASCSVGSIINKFTDGKVKVDDDGNVTIEDEDGKIQTGDKVKWDKDKMHGLSKPDCKLVTLVTTDEGTSYVVEELDKGEFEDLIETIKGMGFTYNTYEMEDSIFVASNKEGLGFSITYDSESSSGSISAVKGEPPEGDDQYNAGDQEWVSSKIGGLPNPGGKITAYVHDDITGESYYVLSEVTDHEGYIEKLIDLGYDNVSEETIDGNNMVWTASNNNGEEVSYFAIEDTVTIKYVEVKE